MPRYVECDMLIGKQVTVCHKTKEEHAANDYDATVLGFGPGGTLRVAPMSCPTDIKFLSGEEISVKL